MKITVTGKAHLEGTSKKTGKPYNFIQFHYNGLARNVVGLGALTASINPTLYPYDKIMVPGEYNIEFNNWGYAVEFAPVPVSSK